MGRLPAVRCCPYHDSMTGRGVRLDWRAALPLGALAVVVLVIIFVELCGRDDVDRDQLLAGPAIPTATLGPTPTLGPSPTPGPTNTPDPAFATATAETLMGGSDRDAIRTQHLAQLETALAEYRAENGSYPTTEGNVQTLCAFRDADAGCALEEVLSPLPEEPLGDPLTQGYWYVSTGDIYVVYAQRESDLFPACEDHPDHLANFDSLLCVRAP